MLGQDSDAAPVCALHVAAARIVMDAGAPDAVAYLSTANRLTVGAFPSAFARWRTSRSTCAVGRVPGMKKAAVLAAFVQASASGCAGGGPPYPAALIRAGFAARRLARFARAQGMSTCSFRASFRTVFIQRRVFICLVLLSVLVICSARCRA